MALPFVLGSCHQEKDGTPAQPTPVKVKTIRMSSSVLSEKGTFSGTVEESSSTSLSFSVMGTVKTLNVKPGDRVGKGTLIATIDPASIQSSYNAAKSALEQAEDAYRRMKELHDKGSLPEIKWVEIESKVQQARSMEEIARKNLEDCRLYAPHSGVIADKTAEAGQNVVPGMPVVKLVTTGQLNVKIPVPETEIAALSIGQEAVIKVSALGGRQFAGNITEKGIVANPLSRSYDVKIRVRDAGADLMPGMVAEVALAGKGGEALHVLPAYVVQLDEQNRSFVWVNANGKAAKRVITCGEFTADGITVASGLSDGDEVIVEGRQKVCEGTSVTL